MLAAEDDKTGNGTMTGAADAENGVTSDVDQPATTKAERKMPKIAMPAFDPKEQLKSLDVAYATSFFGMLKLAEMGLSFVCYVCTLSSVARELSEVSWTEFTMWMGMAVPLAFFLLYVALPHLTLRVPATAHGLLFVEIVYCVISAVFNLIAGCLMANVAALLNKNYTGRTTAAALACICAFLLMGIFGFDAFLKFKDWVQTKQTNRQPEQKDETV